MRSSEPIRVPFLLPIPQSQWSSWTLVFVSNVTTLLPRSPDSYVRHRPSVFSVLLSKRELRKSSLIQDDCETNIWGQEDLVFSFVDRTNFGGPNTPNRVVGVHYLSVWYEWDHRVGNDTDRGVRVQWQFDVGDESRRHGLRFPEL